MEEKELIFKLQSLKSIKPNADWVVLVKQQLFFTKPALVTPVAKWNYQDLFSRISFLLAPKKLAYAFSVMLFMVVGVFGFMQIGNNNFNVAQNSTASLIAVKSSVDSFKEKSHILAGTEKTDIESVSLAIKEVKDVAKKLTKTIAQNPSLAKSIALEVNNNKTYLDIQGDSELKEVSENLYKEIAKQMIVDLESTTLTEDQQKSLDRVKKSYEKGKFTAALEDILLISQSREGN